MEAAVDKMILLPRYTSFAGVGTFLTSAMNVRDYSHVNVTYVTVGALGSTPPTVTVYLQESPDLEIWNDIDADINDGNTDTRNFRFEWTRLKLVMTGADPGFTCWCVGDFVRRHA